MTSKIQKRLLLPNRVRRPPEDGASWVDRRFLQDYAPRLSRDAVLLYFFFTAVSDQHGSDCVAPSAHSGAVAAAAEAAVQRRLAEVEKLSQRAIARRLRCCQRTVAKALRMQQPPDGQRRLPRSSRLAPWKAKIDDLLSRFPDLSASRIHEEMRRSPDVYQGGITIVREYVRRIRRRPSRVYQRAIANALKFFGGSPRRIIFDNLTAAVINGSGRNACLHPEFLALCGHFCLEPIACEWRDEVANVRLHQTTRQKPVDRFVQETTAIRATAAI